MQSTGEREAWLANRRRGIGASEAAAVLGICPYNSSFQLYLEKLGQAPDREQTERMEIGLLMEPVIQTLFERRTGIKVISTQRCIEHPEIPYMIATLDGETDDNAVVDFKAVDTFVAQKKSWGEDGTDDIPDFIQVQIQHQMCARQVTHGYVAALIGGNDYRTYRLERNERLCEIIIEREAAFWKMIQNRTPPPPDFSHRSTPKLIAAIAGLKEGKEAFLPANFAMLADELENAKRQEKNYKEAAESLKAEITYAMQDAAIGILGDGRQIVRSRVNRGSYDVKESSYVTLRVKNPPKRKG